MTLALSLLPHSVTNHENRSQDDTIRDWFPFPNSKARKWMAYDILLKCPLNLSTKCTDVVTLCVTICGWKYCTYIHNANVVTELHARVCQPTESAFSCHSCAESPECRQEDNKKVLLDLFQTKWASGAVAVRDYWTRPHKKSLDTRLLHVNLLRAIAHQCRYQMKRTFTGWPRTSRKLQQSHTVDIKLVIKDVTV